MRLRRVILIAIAVVAIVVAANSLVHTVQSFFVLDFSVTWVENGILVRSVPAGSSALSAGLQVGDRILSIDGVAIERLKNPLFVLSVGEIHQLTLINPREIKRETTIVPPDPLIDANYLARTLVATLALGCAIFSVLSTTRQESTTFLLATAASLLLAAIPFRIANADEVLGLLHRASSAALPILLFRFFAIFPERRRKLQIFDALAACFVIVSALTLVQPSLQVWWPALVTLLRILFGAAILFGIVVNFRLWWTAEMEARTRRQIEWAALGMFVGLTPYCTLVIVPRWIGLAYEPFSWLSVLPIIAVPLGFWAALIEYRLWDIEPITRDSVSATMVVSAGGFIFVLTNHFLLHYVSGLESLRHLFAFATGVLLVVLLQPIRLRVGRFLDQWLHHGRPTPRWLLTHAARDLASASDPRESLMRLSQALRDGLEIDLVATYLREGNGSFVKVTGRGDLLPEMLPANVSTLPFGNEAEQNLRQEGYHQRTLLERHETVHGLLYLGHRRGVLPLGSEGYEVVTTFAAQAALGLENANRLEDLRRHAEEYRILHANTQRIIESSAAGILVCDASARILSANNEAARIFAINNVELVAMILGNLLELPAGWSPILPIHAVNADSKTKSKNPRRIVMAVSVLELDSGSFNGRVIVLQDVTDLRDLQDRVREQEQLASLGRLASGLAHEINTPLTGISSYAQMLGSMTPQEDPRAELVGKLVDQSFRVSRIVANLHEAVRGTRDQMTCIDLVEVATRAAKDAARSIGAHDRLLCFHDEENVEVWGVSGPVELAISNLVRNAVEADQTDSPVLVRIVSSPPWGQVTVEDHGPGIPEHLLTKVFEPFFTTKSSRGGTGLGLAITRDMIVQLGGEVVLDRTSKGGALATIRLKLWKEFQVSS